jgi:hypothetical protein
MRKLFLLLIIVIAATLLKVLAEKINIPGLLLPKLIITEVRPDTESQAYVEITNLGDTAINLEPFAIHSVYSSTRCLEYSDSAIIFNRGNAAVDETLGKVYLKGIIQPGQSYVVATVYDANNSRYSGIPTHNIALAQKGNQFVHRDETFNLYGWINKPEWQCYGKDSISAKKQLLRAGNTAGYLIQWKYTKADGTKDSTYIDQFNHFWYPDENINPLTRNNKGNNIFPISGVVDAMTSSVMVRKSNIDKGNLNWNQSRGVDAATSEWLVVPKNTSKDMAFTTVGVHGSSVLNYTTKAPSIIQVDNGAKTISVPWQMVRGDSLARYFNLGQGMSFGYKQNAVFADSASYIVRTGDMLSFYAVGTELQQADFTLQVREPASDVAVIFPKRRLMQSTKIVTDSITNLPDTTYNNYWSGSFVYDLSSSLATDSIINVSFATRTDSLLKYLDKPLKAKWEFVFVDGQKRVDLKFGDKLRVTSENGLKVKDYFIAVSDYVKGNSAQLSSVTWPDVDLTRYPKWNESDVLPEFNSLKTEYQIELAYDETKIPALQFKTQDARARIAVKNATNLNGSIDQRITSVTVTSESDTISLTYNFMFKKLGAPVQPNIAEPFISEMIWGITTQGYAVEIYNPGSEDLDLSRYMFVAGAPTQTWQQGVSTCVATNFNTTKNGINIYQTHYVPSKRWAADGSKAAWTAVPTPEKPYIGKGFLKDDNQTDPWVKANDVWVMSTGTSNNVYQNKILSESNFIFRGNTPATEKVWSDLSQPLYHQETPVWNNPHHNMWLLKVLNDSILDGTKDVRDPSAYELIDRFELIGDSLAGRYLPTGENSYTLLRKPTVTKGNLERIGGGNETAESSEWIVKRTTDVGWDGTKGVSNIGVHVMNKVTNYLSTVTSVKMIVTPGYSGNDLTITGSISNYNPASIALVLDKADASQTFVFKRGTTVLAESEALAENDLLEVTSGDGKSVTIYKLINSPLDNNTSLMAKAGSGLTVTGNKVTGVTAAMTLKEAVDKLVVSPKSLLYVYDASGALQSFKVHNLDSLKFDAMINESQLLEVVAENNDKATYTFDFALASNEAILVSSVLQIDQQKKLIVNTPFSITSASLLSLVYTNKGATIKVLDKAGFERPMGYVNIDDVIEVTAADGTTKVTYKLAENIFSGLIRNTVNPVSAVEIFPNPVSNVLNITGIDLISVKVYTLTGMNVISTGTFSGNRLNVSDLSNGIYLIEMKDKAGKTVVDKFLKK